jgi:hypothetical protein
MLTRPAGLLLGGGTYRCQLHSGALAPPACAADRRRTAAADTLLLLAVKAHQHDVVAELLKKGADANKPNANGETPLAVNFMSVTKATADNDGSIFNLLVENGVSIEPQEGVLSPLLAVCMVRCAGLCLPTPAAPVHDSLRGSCHSTCSHCGLQGSQQMGGSSADSILLQVSTYMKLMLQHWHIHLVWAPPQHP